MSTTDKQIHIQKMAEGNNHHSWPPMIA